MKATSILLILISFLFVSCDEVEELAEFNVTTTLSETATITLSENNSTYSEAIIISLEDNSDISPYLDQIESVEILEGYYKIENYQGVDEATGTFDVTIATQAFGPYIHNFGADAQAQTEFTLPAAELTTLSSDLLNTQNIVMTFDGTQDPAQNGSFDVEVTLTVKVTAQAL